MSANKSQQRLTVISLLAIISLLIINAALLYNKYKQDKVIHDKNERINEISDMRSDLEKEFYEALSELEEMRGDNEQLNTLIDQQKADLAAQKDRIVTLIKDSDDLKKARIEMSNMRSKIDQYIDEVSRLQSENAALRDSTSSLRQDRLLLTKRIADERLANDELLSEKASLTEQNENLSKERKVLIDKVSRASVIEVQNVQVEGFRYGANGKERNRKKAKNIEVLKVCFDAQANNVAEKGAEKFFVRIVDPTGKTLAIESLGSGILTNDQNDSQVRFTKMAEVDYSNEAKTICTGWEPNLPFKEGEYLVEIYNKGFVCGSTIFELK